MISKWHYPPEKPKLCTEILAITKEPFGYVGTCNPSINCDIESDKYGAFESETYLMHCVVGQDKRKDGSIIQEYYEIHEGYHHIEYEDIVKWMYVSDFQSIR